MIFGGAGGLNGYPGFGVTFLSRSGSCFSFSASRTASWFISRFSLSDIWLLGVLASSSMREETLLVLASLIARLGGKYFIFSVSCFATGLMIVSPSSSESSSVLINKRRFNWFVFFC